MYVCAMDCRCAILVIWTKHCTNDNCIYAMTAGKDTPTSSVSTVFFSSFYK